MKITEEIRAIAFQLGTPETAHLAHQLRLISLDVANMEQVLAEQHKSHDRERLIAALILETVHEQREAAISASANVVILSTHRAARYPIKEAIL